MFQKYACNIKQTLTLNFVYDTMQNVIENSQQQNDALQIGVEGKQAGHIGGWRGQVLRHLYCTYTARIF